MSLFNYNFIVGILLKKLFSNIHLHIFIYTQKSELRSVSINHYKCILYTGYLSDLFVKCYI